MKELNIKIVPVSSLVPYEMNSKMHDPAQVKKIAASITQFGWDQPIVVDRDMVIIKGHGRRLAALELGLKTVPALVRDDLSPDQVKAARLADNRVAISSIDTEMFRAELASLSYDLSEIYDPKELAFSLAELGAIDERGFIDDLDAAVSAQEAATKERIVGINDRRVPIAQALGIKDVKGSDELVVSRFIKNLRHTTGKDAEEALLEHMKSVLSGT